MSSSHATTRRVSPRTALFALSGIALVASITATMSAWTDTATVTADVTSGAFDLTLNGAETVTLGTADQVINPGDTVTGTYTMANASSTAATIDLGVSGVSGATTGAWVLTVSVDDTQVYSGDPTTAPASIDLGTDGALQLAASGTADVDVTLTLSDTATAPQNEAIAPVLTFSAVQA